jgi:hypothetical protein
VRLTLRYRNSDKSLSSEIPNWIWGTSFECLESGSLAGAVCFRFSEYCRDAMLHVPTTNNNLFLSQKPMPFGTSFEVLRRGILLHREIVNWTRCLVERIEGEESDRIILYDTQHDRRDHPAGACPSSEGDPRF